MPSETHQSLLRYGESKGLGLQAYEVAYTSSDKTKLVLSWITALILISLSVALIWSN